MAAISLSEVATSILALTVSATVAILSITAAKSSNPAASANTSVVEETVSRIALISLAWVNTSDLPPADPAAAILVETSAITAADASEPPAADTIEIKFATCAAALLIPADPVATKSVAIKSAPSDRPRPFATCACASAAETGAPPDATAFWTTASTMVVRGVTTVAPSGARNSPVNVLPVEMSVPP